MQNVFCNRTAIKSFRTVVSYQLKRLCVLGVAEELTDLRHNPLGEEYSSRCSIVGQIAFTVLPIRGNNFCDRESVAGVMNRGLKQLRPGQAAKFLMQSFPSPN